MPMILGGYCCSLGHPFSCPIPFLSFETNLSPSLCLKRRLSRHKSKFAYLDIFVCRWWIATNSPHTARFRLFLSYKHYGWTAMRFRIFRYGAIHLVAGREAKWGELSAHYRKWWESQELRMLVICVMKTNRSFFSARILYALAIHWYFGGSNAQSKVRNKIFHFLFMPGAYFWALKCVFGFPFVCA